MNDDSAVSVSSEEAREQAETLEGLRTARAACVANSAIWSGDVARIDRAIAYIESLAVRSPEAPRSTTQPSSFQLVYANDLRSLAISIREEDVLGHIDVEDADMLENIAAWIEQPGAARPPTQEDEAFRVLLERVRIGGIYDDFRTPFDAVEQMALYIREATDAAKEFIPDTDGQSLASLVRELGKRAASRSEETPTPVIATGFHWRHGITFERADGLVFVRVPKTAPWLFAIPNDEWCSIIAAVSIHPNDIYSARLLHNGDSGLRVPSHESAAEPRELTPEEGEAVEAYYDEISSPIEGPSAAESERPTDVDVEAQCKGCGSNGVERRQALRQLRACFSALPAKGSTSRDRTATGVHMTSRTKLPKLCECGGKMLYSFGPGDYIAAVCEACTPVVEVRIASSKGKPEGSFADAYFRAELAEIDRLRADLEAAQADLVLAVGIGHALGADLEAARKALDEYGWHKGECVGGTTCICGWQEIIARFIND